MLSLASCTPTFAAADKVQKVALPRPGVRFVRTDWRMAARLGDAWELPLEPQLPAQRAFSPSGLWTCNTRWGATRPSD